jgi:hypothetical protein
MKTLSFSRVSSAMAESARKKEGPHAEPMGAQSCLNALIAEIVVAGPEGIARGKRIGR